MGRLIRVGLFTLSNGLNFISYNPCTVASIFSMAACRNFGLVVISFISSQKQFFISIRIRQIRIMSLQMVLM